LLAAGNQYAHHNLKLKFVKHSSSVYMPRFMDNMHGLVKEPYSWRNSSSGQYYNRVTIVATIVIQIS